MDVDELGKVSQKFYICAIGKSVPGNVLIGPSFRDVFLNKAGTFCGDVFKEGGSSRVVCGDAAYFFSSPTAESLHTMRKLKPESVFVLPPKLTSGCTVFINSSALESGDKDHVFEVHGAEPDSDEKPNPFM